MKRALSALVTSGLLLSFAVAPARASEPTSPIQSVDGISATPGGPAVPQKPMSLGTARIKFSMSPDQCTKLIADVRAKKLKSYPRNCTDGKVITGREAQATWPAACSTTTSTLIQWTAQSRRQACEHFVGYITVREVPSGKILGTATVQLVGKMVGSTTRASWAYTQDVAVSAFTGIGNPATSVSEFIPCAGDCLGVGTSYTSTGAGSWRGTTSLEPDAMPLGTKQDNYGYWYIQFNSPGWANPVGATTGSPLSRCDNAFGNRAPGCVFGNVPAVAGMSQSAAPEFVDHVYKAQVSGLPGQYTSSTFLTKLDDPAKTAANGSKACPTSIPRPTGKTCDEYPFRSTYQGASTGGSSVARSHPGCQMPDPERTGPTGWSRCFILARDNSSGGGQLSGFYGTERILDGDPFQVGYVA